MALSTTAPAASSGGMDLAGIAKLAELFTGKSTSGSTTGTTGATSSGTSGTANTGTVTQSENVSPEAVQNLVRGILEGTQGLASVASGQNKAGLYNSSTNRLLVNDLISRAAAQGAALNKSTTQTINTQTAGTTGQVQSGTSNQNTTSNTAAPIPAATAAKSIAALQALSALGGTSKIKEMIFGSKNAAKSVQASQAAAGAGANGASASSGALPTTNNSSPNVFDTASNPVASSVTGSPAGAQTGANLAQVQASTPSDNLTSVQSFNQSQSPIQSGGDYASMTGDLFGQDLSSASLAGDIAASDVGASFTPEGGDAASDFGGADFGGADFSGGSDIGGFWDDVGGGYGDFGGGDFWDQAGDFDIGFAEGGLVDKAKMALRGNPQAEAAFASGGDDKAPAAKSEKVVEKATPDTRDQPARPNGNVGARILNYIKGYAAGGKVDFNDASTQNYFSRSPLMLAGGGRVDLTNLGLRVRPGESSTPQQVSAATSPTSVSSPTAILQAPVPVSVKRAEGSDSGTGSVNTAKLNTTSSPSTSGSLVRPARGSAVSPNVDSAGPATSVPSTVGTPSENAAALGGMGIAAASAALGPIGGLAATLGMNALGISHSSMNPVNNLINAVVSAFSGPGSGDDGVASADAVGGMSGPSVSVDGVTTQGQSVTQESLGFGTGQATTASVTGLGSGIGDADSSNGGFAPSVDGLGGASTGDSSGSSGGDSGSSAGGAAGVGGGTGDGDGTGGFSSGGDVSGPGTDTSDSIPAYLSKDEFVLNATAVKAIDKALGPTWLDEINDHFKPSPKKLAEGKRIHKAVVKGGY